MQPDFKTLKPIQDIQPDFATLKPITPLQQQVESLPKSTMFSDLTTLYGGGEQGIAQRLGRDISQGASDIQKGFESGTVKGIAEGLVKGTTKSAFRTAGDVAGAIYAPLTSGLNALSGGLFNKFFEGVNKSLAEGKAGPASWIVDKVSNIPEFQQFAMEHPNAGEDFGRALNLVFAKGDLNKDVSRAFTEPQAVVKEATNQIYKTVANTPTQIKNTIQNTFKNTPEDIINKRTNELNKIDNQYAQLRKASGYSKDNGIESRRRVASTDVLADAVDETGTIRTQGKNGPIEQYKALTLENGENVVKNNLERLGEKVSLKEVQTRLENSVKNSGLEGADLQIALDKIPKEISGLSLKADANGDIPLSVLQDAKISTTKQINYQTPPEVNTYRKSIASAYRDTIEKNSSLNVREVNEELSKYLSDIAFLERLDGKKVSGGKLGKYFAQISGNIIGGATGGAVGGPVGSALGTVIGGEVAGRIKGKLLSKSLGGNANLPTEQSSVIRNAIKQSKLPRLALPEPKQGSPRLRMESTGNPIQLPAEGRTLLGIEEIYSNNLGNRNQQYNPTQTNNSSSIETNNSIKKPNMQGGYISIGGKTFKEIPEATKAEMVKAIDYLRNGKVTPNIEDTVSRLAQKYNISEDLSNAKIANLFEDLIDKTKTKSNLVSVDPLLQEAKKYKSAESFAMDAGSIKDNYDWAYLDEMKSRKKAGYAVSQSDYNYLSKIEKQLRGKESKTFYRAGEINKDGDIWLTPQQAGAEQYANAGGTKVGKYKVLVKNPLILNDLKDIENVLGRKLDSNSYFANNPDLKDAVIKYAKDNGYDSAMFPDSFPDGGSGMESLVVWDKNLIKTKSQLIDIWNKANKK